MKYIMKQIGRFFRRVRAWMRRLFGRPKKWGEIYYVSGSEVLPAPLTHEEEASIIDAIAEDASLKTVLIEHNLRLVVYIAKKFENTGIDLEDLISIGAVGLMKAINTFQSDKNIKLATYASRCIENEILMYIRKKNSQKREISIDEPLNVDWDGNELLLSDILGSEEDTVCARIEEDEERQILLQSVARLNAREKMIIELRYGLCGQKERTQKEVADMLGISQSYISRLEKKILARLRKEIGEKLA